MNTRPDFDRHAAAWLAEGPTELADRTLDAALREVHLTQQRRRWSTPWRVPMMSLPQRAAVAIAIVAVAGFVAFNAMWPRDGVGSRPTPIPTPNPSMAVEDLAGLLPKKINHVSVTVVSVSGSDFIAGGLAWPASGKTDVAPTLQATLTQLGKTPADLSIGVGETFDSIIAGTVLTDAYVRIVAFRIKGMPGSTIVDALLAAYTRANSPIISDVSIGGKGVKKVVPANSTEPTSYVSANGDVVFIVVKGGGGGQPLTDALLNDTFLLLP